MENVTFWIEIVVAILAGLATCIPLVIKLIEMVKVAVKAKNWTPVMQLILKLITEAEQLYATGPERKDYVMASIRAMESTLQYDIDENAISELIDAVIAATKRINKK